MGREASVLTGEELIKGYGDILGSNKPYAQIRTSDSVYTVPLKIVKTAIRENRGIISERQLECQWKRRAKGKGRDRGICRDDVVDVVVERRNGGYFIRGVAP